MFNIEDIKSNVKAGSSGRSSGRGWIKMKKNKNAGGRTYNNGDELVFAEENNGHLSGGKEVCNEKDRWKILIVDDDQDVHTSTRLVLSDVEFEEKKLHFISAYTAEEAGKCLKKNPDIALVLLDVVMEDDNAGLRLVRYIREELQNTNVRIILRTGQPGQAPEKKVITNYDINDYKEKTELTVQKLFSTIISSLRAYRDIQTIEKYRKGLEKIIQSSADIFRLQSMKLFYAAVLSQLMDILDLSKDSLPVSACAVTREDSQFKVMAAVGDYESGVDKPAEEVLLSEVLNEIKEAFVRKRSKYTDNYLVSYYQTKSGIENVVYMQSYRIMDVFDKYLLDIYFANVSVALDNILLNEEIENTQREIICTIGEIVETRSLETGNHVKRVAEYSRLLARLYGLSEEEANMISLAAPMHDIGKVGISDRILNKPGKLTEEEFEIVKKHSQMGHDILKHSKRKIIETATIIANEHHEKYDGTGYPKGLSGEDIHIYGRITAITDVFDALGNDRVYKKAWPLTDILAYFRNQRGKHFDPFLVDLFLDNLEEFLLIKEKYSD